MTVTTIRPPKGWVPIDLKELWASRELLYFLIWRDIKIRYKQTVLGFAWAIIQPVVMMVVFSLFFGTLIKVPSENVPYPLFSYSALVPWTLFAILVACLIMAAPSVDEILRVTHLDLY